MSNQKQFGVWMDTHNAIVVTNEETTDTVSVLAAVKGEKHSPNNNEKNEHNHEKKQQQRHRCLYLVKM